MRWFLIISLAMVASVSALAQYDPAKAWEGISDADRDELLSLERTGKNADFRALDTVRRQQLLSLWTKVMNQYAPARTDILFRVRLGDEEAMRQIATEMGKRERSTHDVEACPWPEILTYVGPLLLLDETPNAEIGAMPPASFDIVDPMLRFIGGEQVTTDDPKGRPIAVLDANGAPIFRNVPTEFSDETIAWARRTRMRIYERNDSGFLAWRLGKRELMRDWWRSNESHFRRRDFKAVRPGRELSGVDLSPTLTTQVSGEAPMSEEREAATASPAPAATAHPPPPSPAAASFATVRGNQTTPSVIRFALIAVVAALLGAGLFLASGRK